MGSTQTSASAVGRLSGGQRQRIAIARALIADAPILVLDEPSTGLDAAAREALVGPLRKLMSNRTTFVISHDLLMTRDADRILVFDDGAVVETGTHDELLDAGGLYSRLWALHDSNAAVEAVRRAGAPRSRHSAISPCPATR